MATKAYNNHRSSSGTGYDLNKSKAQNDVPHGNEDADNVNLENYKGIYANEDNSQKYQCPVTGAHFEVKDLCRRLSKVLEKRKPLEDQIYGP